MGRFSELQRTTLLSVARAALHNRLLRDLPPRRAVQQAVAAARTGGTAAPDDELLADAACFVTLWLGQHGRLRGCRGEFAAHQPLLLAVPQMALAAALDDPRFEPLTPAELPQVRIEVSVLSPLTPIQPSQVELGRHGLLIASGSQRGLLLPEVPIEHHMDRETFLDALCAKAGLRAGAWRDIATNLWSFETEAWEDV